MRAQLSLTCLFVDFVGTSAAVRRGAHLPGGEVEAANSILGRLWEIGLQATGGL